MKGHTIEDIAIRMAESDTVATALADLPGGREIPLEADPIALAEDVPFGHKFALEAMDAGDPVRKYGEVIGTASSRIEPGEWVHTHNCESNRGRGDRAAADGDRSDENGDAEVESA